MTDYERGKEDGIKEERARSLLVLEQYMAELADTGVTLEQFNQADSILTMTKKLELDKTFLENLALKKKLP